MKTIKTVLVICPLGPESAWTLRWTQLGIQFGRRVRKVLKDLGGQDAQLLIATPQQRVARPIGYDFEVMEVPNGLTCSVAERAQFILQSKIVCHTTLVLNISGLTVCRQARLKEGVRMISFCHSVQELRKWSEASGFRPFLVGASAFRWQGWRHFVARRIWWFGSIDPQDLEIGTPISPQTKRAVGKAVARCLGVQQPNRWQKLFRFA